jgi:hypothetical protein
VTIAKGERWGEEVPRPSGLVAAASDAELARLVTDASLELSGGGPPVLTVTGGDLHRALGEPGVRDPVMRLPVDALDVVIDGHSRLATSHVIACRTWWRGPILAVVNAGPVGQWNVAPRAHPNDGRFDIVEVDASMPLRQRLEARRRLPLGTHVPHPSITMRTATEASWHFARPVTVTVDGVDAGRCSDLTVRVRPDHFAIYV